MVGALASHKEIHETRIDESRPDYPITRRLRSKLRVFVLHCSASWFTINMGTGVTSLLLYSLPYQFDGLEIISKIFFALNLLLFVLFLLISTVRYISWPQLFPAMLKHPVQSLYLGAFSMGLTTLIDMCGLGFAPSDRGHPFALFVWAMWWINLAIALTISIGLPILQSTRQKQTHDIISAVWILPIVADVVVASCGAIVADILPPAHARLTITICYIVLGSGLGVIMLVYALYYARLLFYKIPPSELIMSVFIPLGPCGQGSYCILKLADSMNNIVSETGRGFISNSMLTADDSRIMALALQSVSIPLALLLWGFGLFWAVFAVIVVIDLWVVSELKFNISWWGFSFAMGVFTLGTIEFGKQLGSDGFKILGTVLTVMEVILWLFLFFHTFYDTMRGRMCVCRRD